MVSPADGHGDINGAPFLAIDLVGAGTGNWWWSATSARMAAGADAGGCGDHRHFDSLQIDGDVALGRNRRMVDASVNEEMILGDGGRLTLGHAPWE